jgi:dihydrofolate synthase/folylpolyglutamate synthase
VITVAGTNGKGSTVATLTAIYCAAGYNVGTYTSPHITYFNERIAFNGHMASDAVLINAFAYLERHSRSNGYFFNLF